MNCLKAKMSKIMDMHAPMFVSKQNTLSFFDSPYLNFRNHFVAFYLCSCFLESAVEFLMRTEWYMEDKHLEMETSGIRY